MRGWGSNLHPGAAETPAILLRHSGNSLNFRFLKTPGKTIQDEDSGRELLESQEQDRLDSKEEMLEVSP